MHLFIPWINSFPGLINSSVHSPKQTVHVQSVGNTMQEKSCVVSTEVLCAVPMERFEREVASRREGTRDWRKLTSAHHRRAYINEEGI